MPRVDTAELYNALRAAIVADADIAAAMAGGTVMVFENEPDRDDIPIPYMTWVVNEDDDRIEGVAHKTRIQMAIFGPTVDKVREIAGILLDKFQIPKRLPGGIASTNYRLTVLIKVHSNTIPGIVRQKPGGVAMRMHSIEFDGRVRRET